MKFRIERAEQALNKQWCEAFSSTAQVSEIRGSSRNSGRYPFSQDFKRQIVSKLRILDILCDDFRRGSQLCPPHVLNPRTEGTISRRFFQNLEILEKIDFLKSSSMEFRGVKYYPW